MSFKHYNSALSSYFSLDNCSTYGDCHITIDLKSGGETCSKNRILRMMRTEVIIAIGGCRRHPDFKGSNTYHVAPNTLNQEFSGLEHNQIWGD